MRTDDDTCVISYGIASHGIFVLPPPLKDYSCRIYTASYVARPSDASKMDFVRGPQKPVPAEAT
jgi:hypothetical protein